MIVKTFQSMLFAAVQKGASDIHFQVGASPLFRVNGELFYIKYHHLNAKDTRDIVDEILNQSIVEHPSSKSVAEIDVAYNLEGYGRFRANIYLQRGAYNIVLRVIPVVIKSFSELGLPPVLEKIAMMRRGLVLVVGATGNGKSTTVASMIQYINNNRRCHIITVEDPVEYVFENKKSIISQREVGTDTESFTKATLAAMRQDPNVLFVGEMRDQETVDTVLRAAETGHLVISTMHTIDSISSIARLISFYPADQEANIRKRLSNCLVAVVAQRLMPRKDVIGRIPSVEVIRVTEGIRDCIADATKTDDIQLYIEKGRDMYGMQTFDQHILSLVKSGKIDIEVAKQAADSPDDLVRSLMLDSTYDQPES